MAIRTLIVCLTAGTALVGCNAGSGAASHDGGTSSGASSGGPGAQAHPEAGAPTSDGRFAVTLQNSGRHGDDLLFTVQGSDPAGQTTEAHISLRDGSNAPVVAFDTNWDGVPDSAEKRLHFDRSTLGQKTFKEAITLQHLYAQFPTVASAVVSLSDANGKLSPSLTAALAPQSVHKLGESCDANELLDRCASGLSCSGTQPTCHPAAPPALTRIAYYGGDSPSELILGTDPGEDLATLRVDFLDSNNKPVVVNLSGDATPASSAILDARNAAGQTFFFQNDPVAAFAAMVAKISVTPADSLGHAGMPVMASLTTQPVLASGLQCDAYGFTKCAVDTACFPGLAGITNKCTSVSSLQASKCNAAPEAAADLPLAAWGLVDGVSLWDPPVGCASPTAVGHAESVVMLKLAHDVGSLTISTAMPETDLDTVLYVLPACASSSSQALGCNDDTQGFSSAVTLANVPAGTYAIVVDSATPQTGHFGLSVTEM
jgi:hypothetical protein